MPQDISTRSLLPYNKNRHQAHFWRGSVRCARIQLRGGNSSPSRSESQRGFISLAGTHHILHNSKPLRVSTRLTLETTLWTRCSGGAMMEE